MKEIYDNGTMIIGTIYNVKDYVCRNCNDFEEVKEIVEELEDYEEDTIVCINYDNAMGYLTYYWTTKDKVVQ